MKVQQIYLKNNFNKPEQKVGFGQTFTAVFSDKVESSNKKDNTKKYFFAGIAVLAAIVAIVKHKQIGEFFTKLFKTGEKAGADIESKCDTVLKTNIEPVITKLNPIELNVEKNAKFQFKDLIFNKGIVSFKNGKCFSGEVEDTLKCGDFIKINIVNGRIIESNRSFAKPETIDSIHKKFKYNEHGTLEENSISKKDTNGHISEWKHLSLTTETLKNSPLEINGFSAFYKEGNNVKPFTGTLKIRYDDCNNKFKKNKYVDGRAINTVQKDGKSYIKVDEYNGINAKAYLEIDSKGQVVHEIRNAVYTKHYTHGNKDYEVSSFDGKFHLKKVNLPNILKSKSL